MGRPIKKTQWLSVLSDSDQEVKSFQISNSINCDKIESLLLDKGFSASSLYTIHSSPVSKSSIAL